MTTIFFYWICLEWEIYIYIWNIGNSIDERTNEREILIKFFVCVLWERGWKLFFLSLFFWLKWWRNRERDLLFRLNKIIMRVIIWKKKKRRRRKRNVVICCCAERSDDLVSRVAFFWSKMKQSFSSYCAFLIVSLYIFNLRFTIAFHWISSELINDESSNSCSNWLQLRHRFELLFFFNFIPFFSFSFSFILTFFFSFF